MTGIPRNDTPLREMHPSLTPPYPALIIGRDVNIEAHVSTELD